MDPPRKPDHSHINLTPLEPMTFISSKDGSKFVIKDNSPKFKLQLYKVEKDHKETYVGFASYQPCTVDASGNDLTGKPALGIGYLLIENAFRTKKLSYLLGAAVLSKMMTWYSGNADPSVAKLVAIKPDPGLVSYWTSVGLKYPEAQQHQWNVFKETQLVYNQRREENERLKAIGSVEYDPSLDQSLGPILEFNDATYTTSVKGSGTVSTAFVMEKPSMIDQFFSFIFKSPPVQVLIPTCVEVNLATLNAKVAAELSANGWKIEGASVKQ